MLAALATYLVIGLAVIIPSMIMFALGYIYKIREQYYRGLTFLFLSLAFWVALAFQNSVTEKLLFLGYGYPQVKAWDVSLISAWKGAIIEATIVPGAWQPYTWALTAVVVLSMITGALASYLALLSIGVDSKKALATAIVFLVIGGIALAWTAQAVNLALQGNIVDAYPVRDRANILKALLIILPFLLMAWANVGLYRETGTNAYLVHAVSIVLGVLGFLVMASTWFRGWEQYVVELAKQGNLGPAYARFTFAALLMIFGAGGVLLGSILEATPPAEEAVEEELGEIEEEAVEAEEAEEQAAEEEAGEEA